MTYLGLQMSVRIHKRHDWDQNMNKLERKDEAAIPLYCVSFEFPYSVIEIDPLRCNFHWKGATEFASSMSLEVWVL